MALVKSENVLTKTKQPQVTTNAGLFQLVFFSLSLQSFQEAGGEHDRDAVKKAITELGLSFNLATKHTSFIGVDEKESEGHKTYRAMQRRDVPNQMPRDYGAVKPPNSPKRAAP